MRAVIPTIGLAPQLPALVDQLFDEGLDEVLLTVNEPDAYARLSAMGLRRHLAKGNLWLEYSPGSIYLGWNKGLARARRARVDLLAILNDDVALQPGALAGAAKLMEPEPTVAVAGLDIRPSGSAAERKLRFCDGTYQHGCVHGCALVVRPELAPDVDGRFEWWYGDDDLVRQVRRDGNEVAVAEGCHVEHQGEASAARRPWTQEARLRDAERFEEKWGR